MARFIPSAPEEEYAIAVMNSSSSEAPTCSFRTCVLPALSAASAFACVYHGYKRNNGSVAWAVGWGLLGGLAPVFMPALALAEGFGKPLSR